MPGAALAGRYKLQLETAETRIVSLLPESKVKMPAETRAL